LHNWVPVEFSKSLKIQKKKRWTVKQVLASINAIDPQEWREKLKLHREMQSIK